MVNFFNSFRDALLAQRDRWVLWLPLPVALGIALYFSMPAEPPLMAGVTVLVFLAALCAPFHQNKAFMYGWTIVFMLALGFAAGQVRTWMVAGPVLEKKAFGVILQGRVTEVTALQKGLRVVLDNLSLEDGDMKGQMLPKQARIKLKGNDSAKPVAGDTIRLKTVLMPLPPPMLPGAYDFQRNAFFKGLGATGYAIGDAEILQKGQDNFFFPRLRSSIRERVSAEIADKDHAALITAFMVGDDDGISEKIWDICRLSGIAHLIAISGSHFLLIAGFAFFTLRAILAAIPYIALRWPIKKIAAGFAMAVAIFYMLLIGAPIPAQRAVLSVCVIMGAILLDRDPFTLRLVAFSALVILLFEPEALPGASFQLSFAAVAGLVAVYEATSNWWSMQFRDASRMKRLGLYLLGCFMSTAVAGISTAPFSLYHFSSMSLTGGMVANMIAVPLSSFVTFPAGLIACLLMPLGLEHWPLRVMEISLGLIMDVARTVAAWPHASQHADAWPPVLLAVMALGGLWLVIWQGRVRYIGLAPIAIAALLIPFSPRPDILVNSRVDLFAVRGHDGKLWLSSEGKEKFTRNEWQDREGGRGIDFWPETGPSSVITCTEGNCTYKAKGHTVVFVKTVDGLPADCSGATLVLSAEPFKETECRHQTAMLDKWDLWRNGAAAIYLQENGSIRVDTVRDWRGKRPWTGRQ